MSLRVPAIVLATAVAAASYAVTDRSSPHPTTPPSSVTPQAPPPTAQHARDQPDFVDTVAPPRLLTTGPDYRAILQSQLDYSNWIVEHDVDAALVARVAAPGSPWETGLRQTITRLQHDHLHYDEQYDGPSTLTLISTRPDVVSARYTQPITRERWLDGYGNVRREFRPPQPTMSYIAVMARAGDNEWRLVSVDER